MKNILKALLLHSAIMSTILFLGLVDSLSFLSILIWIIIEVILIKTCIKYLSYRDFYKYSGSMYFNKLLSLK